MSISITENKDTDEIIIKSGLLDVSIDTLVFGQITALHLFEQVSIMELCLSYQEQIYEK